MLRSMKNVAITTWLEGVKTLIDVMPDDGTFICQYAKKQDLYDQFMLEACDDTSGVLEKCTQDYFLKTWSKLYQEIRVRNTAGLPNVTFARKGKQRCMTRR